MQTFADALLREVQRLISEEAENEANILTLGNVGDYATYREKVGRLYAYNKVVKLFETAQDNLEKR